jgi:hypothetical protein
MDFAFFEQMTPEEAETFFLSFVKVEGAAVEALVVDANEAGVAADFSLGSMPSVFQYASQRIDVTPVEADDSLPKWIRTSATYSAGLYELAEPSRTVTVRLSFYLGETFVRRLGLSWGIGDEGTAVVHQPVIDGFRNGVQMAPLLVTENLLLRLIEGEPTKTVEAAIETWKALAA